MRNTLQSVASKRVLYIHVKIKTFGIKISNCNIQTVYGNQVCSVKEKWYRIMVISFKGMLVFLNKRNKAVNIFHYSVMSRKEICHLLHGGIQRVVKIIQYKLLCG
ncbi:hypothetical protein ACOMHN_006939 [Nucella lapillus]